MELRDALKISAKAMPAKRFRHTLGVVKTAEELARIHHVDVERAKLAAVLHDLAKGLSLSYQLKLAKRWGLITCQEDEKSPYILHGPIAGYWLKHFAGVEDDLIIRAVSHHTLGAPGMSELEMIVYSADLVEPGRSFPEVDFLRRALYDNLITGTLKCVEHTLNYLQRTEQTIHPLTLETYKDLQRRTNFGT